MKSEIIGNATLYCGDALDVIGQLPANSLDLIACDPPYMINTKSDGMGKLSPWADICNGSYWFAEWIRLGRSRLKQTGALWACLNWRSFATYQKAVCEARWSIESVLIWDKQWIGPGGQKGLRPSYEMVALMAQPDFAVPDRGLPDIKAFPWSSQKPNGHPAEKPEALFRWLIEISTKRDGLVADFFLGSGTTGAAAITAGRSFIGVEQDERWFDVACRRIEAAQRQADLFVRTPDLQAAYDKPLRDLFAEPAA